MQDDWEDNTVVAGSAPIAGFHGRKRAQLVVLAGPNVGELYCLDGVHTLGRGRNADLRIHGDGISREHVRFVVASGEVVLEDLGSTNGCFVNGQRVDRATLQDGDKLQVGSGTLLKFTYQDEVEQEFQRHMYESASRDALTNAYNRRFFLERLNNEVAFSERHKTPLTLIMFDIDHFKRVNDNYGHLAGDYVLATLSTLVEPAIRTEDVFARYGGEEFAVLARGTGAQAATTLAERIRASIEHHPFEYEGCALVVTTSLGVVTVPRAGIRTPEAMLAAADEALYTAKRQGRNRVVVG